MKFPHIEDALSVSRRHLAKFDEALPDTLRIESLLVASIVLLIVSHYEGHLTRQFVERAERSGDSRLTNFVKHQTARSFRSPDIGKINDVLNQFDVDYKMHFMGRIANTQAHASWDNIMRARHAVVHGTRPTNMTLRELEVAYHSTLEVLVALRTGLGLPG